MNLKEKEEEHNLAIGQQLEIDAIIRDWKANLSITTVTRRQEKVLELMRKLDSVKIA